jgi:hypothetical protein
VQESLSAQSPSLAQQPASGARSQRPVPTSQASPVHALPSLQSAALVQQPGTEVTAQRWEVVSQLASRQAPGSAQSAFEVQQPLIGLATQLPPGPLQ